VTEFLSGCGKKLWERVGTHLGGWQVLERWPVNNLKQYMRDMRYSTTWKQWEQKRVFSWNTQHRTGRFDIPRACWLALRAYVFTPVLYK